MADSVNLPYMPPIGAICTARRLNGQWRIIKHASDGLVRKCVLESMGPTKQVVTRFAFEITELSSCTYVELNDFLKSVSGLSQVDFEDLDESFDLENLPEDSLIQENAPLSSTIATGSEQEPPSKRFKSVSDNEINHLISQNSEKSTERQTKWAVKLLKGRYVFNFVRLTMKKKL